MADDAATLERLQGTVERLTFHNPENGFSVLKLSVKGHKSLVSVVGHASTISVGEHLDCKGQWITDKRHGLQFKAETVEILLPNSLAGIEKYLASGMIKGVGQHFAKKLVKAFGKDVFHVIDEEPERLLALEGIGKKRVQGLIQAWSGQRALHSIMIFLQSHGLGSARAFRIYKTYGKEAVEKIRENPYRLILDIQGFGFTLVDEFALRLGVAKDALIRAQAGVCYVLQSICRQGHCACTLEQLMARSQQILNLPDDLLRTALQDEIKAKRVILETLSTSANVQSQPPKPKQQYVFPALLHEAEVSVAAHIQRLLAAPFEPVISDDGLFAWLKQKTKLTLSTSQQAAVEMMMAHKVLILTGGPGVGKTTVVNSILKIFQQQGCSIMLAAPTGRAAKRLMETTQMEAKTIHRLLGYEPGVDRFHFQEGNPLAVDFLVVDEASMIDIQLMRHLLAALPDETLLLLVGDSEQLPSVGPGNVLSDLISSGCMPVARLTEIFRQSSHSTIILNAHRINAGQLPLPNEAEGDFFTLYVSEAEALQTKIINLVSQRLPQHYHVDPIKDIQVLTPMNKGALGTRTLNVLLQERLNGQSQLKISRAGSTFAVGDKVMQISNNYDKEVYNGDMGVVRTLDLANSTMSVLFDNKTVSYSVNELDEITLAYAISIHKSQGSEYPVVVIPLSTQHYALLAKNLLYTAVTRGKSLVILVAQKRALELAVDNTDTVKRVTALDVRIADDELS